MDPRTVPLYFRGIPPGGTHFTGNELMIEHVEKYWCPSFISADLTGRAPFRFKEDPRVTEAVDPASLRAKLPPQ